MGGDITYVDVSRRLCYSEQQKFIVKTADFQHYVMKFTDFVDLIMVWSNSHHTTIRSPSIGGHRHVDFYRENNSVELNHKKSPQLLRKYRIFLV